MNVVVMFHSLRAALACIALVVVAGCGTAAGQAQADGRLNVVASFYPLEFAAKRVGGDHVSVTDLTKAGVEPHELELTPRQVATVARADAVVYLSGFQPSVDNAVPNASSDARVNVAKPADLVPATKHGLTDMGSTTGGPAYDPHFWLDPVRMRAVITAIGKRFASLDPDHATDYTRNAAHLDHQLTKLTEAYRAGLKSCASKDLVTSHTAFGYLAARYGLHQIGITGLNPEAEPDPGTLAKVARYVERHHITTIYYETLASPKVADTLASETGATTAVLDPIEGITSKSKGSNYLAVMRSNLAALQKGQQCH